MRKVGLCFGVKHDSVTYSFVFVASLQVSVLTVKLLGGGRQHRSSFLTCRREFHGSVVEHQKPS